MIGMFQNIKMNSWKIVVKSTYNPMESLDLLRRIFQRHWHLILADILQYENVVLIARKVMYPISASCFGIGKSLLVVFLKRGFTPIKTQFEILFTLSGKSIVFLKG